MCYRFCIGNHDPTRQRGIGPSQVLEVELTRELSFKGYLSNRAYDHW